MQIAKAFRRNINKNNNNVREQMNINENDNKINE